MKKDSPPVYLRVRGLMLLAFCCQCDSFLGGAPYLGNIAVAARAHVCEHTAKPLARSTHTCDTHHRNARSAS